jgi:hypothetical protein
MQAKILSPHKLRDRTYGGKREHDVVVIINQGHHELITAIECRDRSRPVGVPQVEAFSKKCEDTGVHRGVIVLSKGFQKTALEKARHLGIECLSLDEVKGFDWIAAGCIKFYRRRVEKFECKLILDTKKEPVIENLLFKTSEGTAFYKGALLKNIQEWIEAQTTELETGTHRIALRITTDGFTVEDGETKFIYALQRIDVIATVIVESEDVPIKTVVYRQEGSEEVIGRAAVANFEFPECSSDLVFSRNPDETTTISLVRRPHASN